MITGLIWQSVFLILALLFLYVVNDVLLISLKIKKSTNSSVTRLSKSLASQFNREISFYESPLITNGFGVHYFNKNRIGLVVSSSLVENATNEDFVEITKNIIDIYESKLTTSRLFAKFWTVIFVLPFTLINLPSLFLSQRLFIIEKFFALPIYFFSLVINQNLIINTPLAKYSQIKFRENSVLSQIDEHALGPQLLFYLNSSYYKNLRNKYFEAL